MSEQVSQPHDERRSEARREIDASVQANVDWLARLDAQVNAGALTEAQRTKMIAFAMTLRERRAKKATEKVEQKSEQTLRDAIRLREDALTGLQNRRALDEDYASLIEDRATFGCLLVDVDEFKPVNDRHGHPVGDKVLVRVAKDIAMCVRQLRADESENDRVYRYGGDEFIVLAPDVQDDDDLEMMAEHIRKFIAVVPFFIGDASESAPGLRIPITVSIGGGIHRPGSDVDIFETADKRLYEAKRRGRNQTVIVPSVAPL